ncbi:MAG TPA: FAD-dependent oxidoreductase [Nitriliruptorales bacterium]|nr:FAD-dependent oxidoreductase [Nitriliruptorales bacterium]
MLGAGPAGIGAAYRLAAGHQHVVVLERARRVGGAAASFDVAGLRVDHGSHRLHPSTDAAILSELRRLLGSDLQRRPRRGRIRLLGRWLAFPLRPADLLRWLPPRFILAAARDAAFAPTRRPRADTFAEVLRAQLGPTLCDHFYFPYARKLWGVEPHQLAGEQARRRVSADSPGKLLGRLLRGGRRDADVFWYPRRGFGQLWETLAAAAAGRGADIRLATTVEQVRLTGAGVEVVTDGGGCVAAGMAWSTLPLPLLARMVDPPPARAVLDAAGGLRFRAMVLVYLVLDTDRYTRFDAHYLPESWTPVTRVSEPKNYRDSGLDPPDRTVLCAEIPCDVDDVTWRAGEEELARLVRATLVEAGATDPHPRQVVVRRLPSAYPVYGAGYERALATLDAWAATVPHILTFGRQGLFVHDNSHHALSMAWSAADALSGDGRFDRECWADARRRFAAHVVQD